MKKKMQYDCQWDNSPQETKMKQKLTTIGHRTAFNNEQSPYRIVSYKIYKSLFKIYSSYYS